MPGRSAATIGKWPGRTPNSPCTLGAVTSSTVSASARPFGVTISSSILSAILLLRLLHEVDGLGLHLLDVADEVEGLLRVLLIIVVLAGEDFLEARDRLLQRDIFARRARELRGDEERLREEALDLARARDDDLVLFGQLVHAE